MVTLSEFEKVQELLGRPGRPRRKTYDFPYTGLIRCGECGFAVTAEHKTNRFGSHYTYYHCSWRRLDYHCTQRSVSAEQLDLQMARFLEETALPERFHSFEAGRLERLVAHDEDFIEKQKRALENQAAAIDRQLSNLKKLRIRDILDDAEFLEERQNLTRESMRVAQELQKLAEASDRFEPAELLVAFSKEAASRFQTGSPDEKRLILQIVGSNPRLQDRELKIDAAKPFRRWSKTPTSVEMRAFVHEVRTLVADPEFGKKLGNIQQLMTTDLTKPGATNGRKAA